MTTTSQSFFLRTALAASLVFLQFLACGRVLAAQGTATVTIEENLRAEPQGIVLGQLMAGAVLPVAATQEQWVQVDLEGWIWTQSVQATQRQGYDLVVSAAPEENLRVEPSGQILAHLVEGALLEQLEQGTGWTRVRRRAWVWAASVRREENPAIKESGTPLARGGDVAGDQWWSAGPGRAPLLSVPDGDTLVLAVPGTNLRVLARQGNWLRVQMEGWAWAPLGEVSDTASSGAVVLATPEDVAQNPGAYRGALVGWDLQFISSERAERVRTDFYEGEPFLLTRAATSGNQFVYVAVPPERLSEVEGLIPLERIRVTGRIRVGAAALTGNPILDLLEIIRF